MKRYIFVFAAAMIAVWSLGANNSYTPVACKGSTITLTADSADNADFFQWYKDGVRIADATNATLEVEITDYTQHTYSVTSRVSDPQVGNNLFANGSFESTTFDYHTCSDYGYRGVNPNPVYGQGLPTTDIFFICQNKQVHQLWGDFHDNISAADGNSFAVFDAKAGKRAWYARTATNPNLKLKAGREYIFSYSAVNINHHNWNRTNKASYDNPNNWTNVYCYIWDEADGNRKVLGNWPGTQATKEEGSDYWTVELPERAKNSWKLIWSNGNGQQTGDLTYATPSSYMDTIDWHPAKLMFKVKNLTTNEEYPLATIDLDCGENHPEKHKWIREQATFTPSEDMNNVEINVTDMTSAEMGNDFGLDYLIFQQNNYENSRAVDSTIFVVKATTPEFTVSNPAAECSDGTARTLTLNYNITNGAPYYYTIDYANASIADVTTQQTLTKKTGKGTITLNIPAGIYGTQTGKLKMWDQGKTCTEERDFSFTLNKIPELTIGRIANVETNATELKIAYTVPANSSAATWSLQVNDSHFGSKSNIAVVSSGATISIPMSSGVTPGTYTATVTVKSSAECEKVYTMPFQVLGSVGIEFAHSPYQVCVDADSIELDYTVATGTPTTYTLSVSGGNFTAVTTRTAIPASPWKIALNGTPAGTYTMTATVYNPAGDVHTQSSAQIVVNPIPTMVLTIPNVCSGMDFVTVAYTTVDADSYVYTFEGVTSSAQPAATDGSFDLDISSLAPGEYIVHATPDNTAGCVGEDTQASFMVLAPKTAEETISSCGTYVWNDAIYTESGDYEFATTTSLGCDSVVTLHLKVLNDNLMYTKWSNLVLCADRNRDLKSYQWYINGVEVPGATGQYFTGDDRILTEKLSVRAITQSGDTLYSCEKTFAEITTSSEQSKEEYTLPQNGPVRVYSISGRLLRTTDGNLNDVIGHLPAGIYILRYDDKSFRQVVY